MMKNLFFLTVAVALTAVFTGCNKMDAFEDQGVEIGGYTWATRNVGKFGQFVANPEDYGMFYQWNRKKAWESKGATVKGWDGTTPSGTVWATANDPCPKGWQVPTKAQLDALASAAHVWGASNGVNGVTIGTGANTIFLPMAGMRHYDQSELFFSGTEGHYWSSEEADAGNAFYLIFYFSDIEVFNNYSKVSGQSIRCVKN